MVVVVVVVQNGELSKQAFLSLWKEIAGDNEKEGVAQNLLTTDLERVLCPPPVQLLLAQRRR